MQSPVENWRTTPEEMTEILSGLKENELLIVTFAEPMESEISDGKPGDAHD